MNQKLKRMILLFIPSSVCNLRCSYCYITQIANRRQDKFVDFEYSPKHIGRALSKERLGGVCFVNICADGETLLQKELVPTLYEILKQGHYVEVVTNALITKKIDEILNFPKEFLERVEFKCSFHYEELKNKNLLNTFADNVNKIWKAGCSANIEITPHDELLKQLKEIKDFSMKNFKALPHLTIARNDATKNIDYLTDMSLEEYDKVWGSFDSDFWKFKKSVFGKKITDYCYAGKWSLFVNLATGDTRQCYCTNFTQNIFKDLSKPIKFEAIGKCKLPHCYNAHAFLTLGLVKDFTDVKYGDIRDRECIDKTHWLQPELKDFFNQKLQDNNETDTSLKKSGIYLKKQLRRVKGKLK